MSFPDGVADFRSDTVTRPTPEMRRAMAEASVGDDAYREDPTVNELEGEVAAALGKESALFVPSGTMGNQLSLVLSTDRGEEVWCGRRAHIRNAERGAGSAWSGVSFRALGDDKGVISADEVEMALAEAGTYRPQAGLLAWEVSHYFSGGTVAPIEVMEKTSAAAHAGGLRVHLDGARMWNAVAASGIPGSRYAAVADSVMFCFSKGLGAPVGSIMAGGSDFVDQARAIRKRMGGGMRQAGVLAAPALVAFRDRDRLADDHARARRLGEALAARYPAAVDLATVQTNMVMVDEPEIPHPPGALIETLANERVLAGYVAPGRIRFAVHRDIDDADVDRLLAVVDSL